jgi:hypothetical protein
VHAENAVRLSPGSTQAVGGMRRRLGARRPVASCVVSVAVVSLVACRSAETVARERFESLFMCPEDRITVTSRKDLNSLELAFRRKPAPSDVAADPGRLELWNQEQARGAADYEGMSVVQARGCGKEVFLICGQLRVSVGATQYGCTTATYPPIGGTQADAAASR